MTAWIALLRGINVGTANRVRMDDLKRMCEGLEIDAPQTYIQSGNVVFAGVYDSKEDIEPILEAAFVMTFGFSIDFVVRSLPDLRRAIAANPFPEAAEVAPSRLLIHFFKRPPAPGARPRGVDREEVQIVGSEAYVHYPEGIASSKLKLPEVSTARNWNTVLKLEAMAADVEPRA